MAIVKILVALADSRTLPLRNSSRVTTKTEIVPMFCGTAFKNKGVQAMLDGVINLLPSPVDVPAIKGVDVDDETKELERHSSDKEPFSALAFKIMTDPFVGSLTFFRVYSGTLNAGDQVYNSVKSKKERIGRLLQMHSNNREEIKEVLASMGLRLGMDIPGWPPENIEEMAKKLEQEMLG